MAKITKELYNGVVFRKGDEIYVEDNLDIPIKLLGIDSKRACRYILEEDEDGEIIKKPYYYWSYQINGFTFRPRILHTIASMDVGDANGYQSGMKIQTNSGDVVVLLQRTSKYLETWRIVKLDGEYISLGRNGFVDKHGIERHPKKKTEFTIQNIKRLSHKDIYGDGYAPPLTTKTKKKTLDDIYNEMEARKKLEEFNKANGTHISSYAVKHPFAEKRHYTEPVERRERYIPEHFVENLETERYLDKLQKDGCLKVLQKF